MSSIEINAQSKPMMAWMAGLSGLLAGATVSHTWYPDMMLPVTFVAGAACYATAVANLWMGLVSVFAACVMLLSAWSVKPLVVFNFDAVFGPKERYQGAPLQVAQPTANRPHHYQKDEWLHPAATPGQPGMMPTARKRTHHAAFDPEA